MAVSKRYRYGLGAFACRVGGTKKAFGAFDAWPKRCLATEMLHTCGDPRRRPTFAKARQGSADKNVCIFVILFLLRLLIVIAIVISMRCYSDCAQDIDGLFWILTRRFGKFQ